MLEASIFEGWANGSPQAPGSVNQIAATPRRALRATRDASYVETPSPHTPTYRTLSDRRIQYSRDNQDRCGETLQKRKHLTLASVRIFYRATIISRAISSYTSYYCWSRCDSRLCYLSSLNRRQ